MLLLPNLRQVDNNAARRSNGTESEWQTLYTGKDVSFDATLRPGRYYVVRVVAKLVEQGASGADAAALKTQTSDGHLFRTIPMAPEDMGPPTQNGGGRNILKVRVLAFFLGLCDANTCKLDDVTQTAGASLILEHNSDGLPLLLLEAS